MAQTSLLYSEKAMTKDELFNLYGKVQKKDKAAEKLLIQEHKKQYPDHFYHKVPRLLDSSKNNRYRQDVHIMYLHLYR